jgi:hypothetical protein
MSVNILTSVCGQPDPGQDELETSVSPVPGQLHRAGSDVVELASWRALRSPSPFGELFGVLRGQHCGGLARSGGVWLVRNPDLIGSEAINALLATVWPG